VIEAAASASIALHVETHPGSTIPGTKSRKAACLRPNRSPAANEVRFTPFSEAIICLCLLNISQYGHEGRRVGNGTCPWEAKREAVIEAFTLVIGGVAGIEEGLESRRLDFVRVAVVVVLVIVIEFLQEERFILERGGRRKQWFFLLFFFFLTLGLRIKWASSPLRRCTCRPCNS